MTTGRFDKIVLGANLAGTDNADGSITVDASTGGGGLTEYDYVTRTTDLTISATSAATADTLISGNAVAYDGSTRVNIEAWARFASVPSGEFIIVTLWDGSTDLGRITQAGGYTGVTGSPGMGIYGSVFITPSNATHTYHIKAWKTGAVTAKIYGNSTDPGFPVWYRITGA